MRRDETIDRAKRAWNSISDEYNGWDALSEEERETYIALSAALSEQTLPVRVKIKPLDWRREAPYHVARVFGGLYAVEAWDGGVTLSGIPGRRDFKTVEAAKHAAQQDYETRIRSSLVDNSHASEEVVEKLREALEAARAWIDIVRGSCGSVEMPSWDNRDPSQIERETFGLIDDALSSLRPAGVGSATDTTGTGGGE